MQHTLQSFHVRSFGSVLGCAAVTLLCSACSGGEVNLGGGSLSQDLNQRSRCRDSTTLNEDVHVQDQAELDELRGCETIQGLFIEPFEGTDLTALSSLRVVTTALNIGAQAENPPQSPEEQLAADEARQALIDAGWVTSLDGLQALERVGTFYLNGVGVENLEGLDSLTSIDNGFLPQGTPRLRDFSGLEGVALDQVWVTDAPELTSLDGLTLADIAESLIFERVPKLMNIDALAPVSSSSTLILSGTGLTSLPEAFGGNYFDALNIDNNAELVDVDSLGQLVSAGSIYIAANPKLRSLPSFGQLFTFDTLVVLGNASLEELNLDFPVYQVDTWSYKDRQVLINPPLIEIAVNESLTRISIPVGLTALQFLSIHENPALAEIELGVLHTVGSLFVDQNPQLESLAAPSLVSADHLEVTANPLLDASAFDAVQAFTRIITPDEAPAAPAAP